MAIKENMRVACNGYIGTVVKVHEGQLAGMADVRLERGMVCVSVTELTRAMNTATMNSLKIRVYNDTKESAKFNSRPTSWCQGVGNVPAVPAGDLKPGHVIVYNTGAVSKVLTVKEKGKASVLVSVLNHDGKIYEDNLYRRTRLVPVVVTGESEPVILPELD